MATHGDCANFRDGFCVLKGVAVDPSAPACPSFTPKSSTPASQTPVSLTREYAGEQVPDVVMREPWEKDWEALHLFAYEMHNVIELSRSASSSEARSAISWFFRQWALENPSEELRYMEIKGMSAEEAARFGLSGPSYYITTHLIHHSPGPIAVGAIAVAISTVLIFVFAHIIEIAVIAAVVIGIIAMWRFVNYWFPERAIYKCPKCGEEFKEWVNFELHFRTMHSEQQMPPKPTEWGDYIKLGVVAVTGLVVAWVGLKLFRRRRKK